MADQVTSKSWPEEIKSRRDREQHPFMLIINENFSDFDPWEHKWTIIWCSEHIDHQDHIHIVLT